MERFEDFAVATALGWGGDWDGARDAAQDAFAQAAVRIGELREPAAFPGWFAMLVRTACTRRARRAMAALAVANEIEIASEVNSDPAAGLIASEEIREVRAAVEALPERERTVIALHYLGDLPYREIARFLGITESATRKRAFTARQRMKELLPMISKALTDERPSRSGGFRDTVMLFAAVRRRDVATVSRLLDADPTLVRTIEVWTWEEAHSAGLPRANEATPLIRAVETGDAAVVEALLRAGAPVDAHCACDGAETPLWTAVIHGETTIVDRLLHAGADPNATSFSHSTALHASAQRHPEMMPMLLAAGADPECRDDGGRTATDWLKVRAARRPKQRVDDAAALATGIRALELFAPIRRGDRQFWPASASGTGQTVVLTAVAAALGPQDIWWIGFASGAYDHAGIDQTGRELGVRGRYQLAAEGPDATARREVFSDALRQVTASDRRKVVICLSADGFQHDVTLALPELSDDPSIMTTIVLQTPTDECPQPASERPEGYDIQVAFDPLRARRQLYPAIDSAATSTGHYPDAHHARLAQETAQAITRYRKSDPELTLPDPASLRDPMGAAVGQTLLRYLFQPLPLFEHFHSIPSTLTPRDEVLLTIEAILADKPGAQIRTPSADHPDPGLHGGRPKARLADERCASELWTGMKPLASGPEVGDGSCGALS